MTKAKKTSQTNGMTKKTSPAKKTTVKKTTNQKTVTNNATQAPLSYIERPMKNTGRVDEVSIRMYCHGFGDCFLLTFMSNGSPVYRMLIDCGVLTGDCGRL